MPKAVIFDIDGVLLDSFEANLDFFQRLVEKAGYAPPTREEYREVFHLPMLETIKLLTKSSSEEEITKIWEMGRARVVKYQSPLLIMPKDAKRVIKELSQKYLLGIVTSRVTESVFESSQLLKLKHYFGAIVSFQDTINHKPHPEPLQLAAKRLRVKPGECVYIGDAENDIIAAQAAGMKVIFYSKNSNDQADASTSSFAALPELINNV